MTFIAFQGIIVIFSLNVIISVLVESYETVVEETTAMDGMWMHLVTPMGWALLRHLVNFLRRVFFFWLPTRYLPRIFRASPKLKLEMKFQRSVELADMFARTSTANATCFGVLFGPFGGRLWKKSLYTEEKSSFYITEEDFAEIVGDDILAHDVFVQYRKLKETVMFAAADSRSSTVKKLSGSTRRLLRKMYKDEEAKQAGSTRMMARGGTMFYVQTVAPSGRKSKPTVSIDDTSFEACVWSTAKHLRRRIPLSKIICVERTKSRDGARLRLVFAMSSEHRTYEKPYIDMRLTTQPDYSAAVISPNISKSTRFVRNAISFIAPSLGDMGHQAKEEALRFRALLLEAAKLREKGQVRS